MGAALFSSWPTLGRTLVVGVCAYIALVAILRVSGRRTLSKMNGFDFVVTVALGSILAAVILDHDVPLVEGVLAIGLLVGLQYAITWSSVRAAWVREIVTGEPLLLVHRGKLLRESMKTARVTNEEIRAAVREAGVGAMADVEGVVLETDGSLSVISSRNGSGSILDEVQRP